MLKYTKLGIHKNYSQKDILQLVQHKVAKTYTKCINSIKSNNDLKIIMPMKKKKLYYNKFIKFILPFFIFPAHFIYSMLERKIPSINTFNFVYAYVLFDAFGDYQGALVKFKNLEGKKDLEAGKPEYYIALCYEMLGENNKAEEYYEKSKKY